MTSENCMALWRFSIILLPFPRILFENIPSEAVAESDMSVVAANIAAIANFFILGYFFTIGSDMMVVLHSPVQVMRDVPVESAVREFVQLTYA